MSRLGKWTPVLGMPIIALFTGNLLWLWAAMALALIYGPLLHPYSHLRQHLRGRSAKAKLPMPIYAKYDRLTGHYYYPPTGCSGISPSLRDELYKAPTPTEEPALNLVENPDGSWGVENPDGTTYTGPMVRTLGARRWDRESVAVAKMEKELVTEQEYLSELTRWKMARDEDSSYWSPLRVWPDYPYRTPELRGGWKPLRDAGSAHWSPFRKWPEYPYETPELRYGRTSRTWPN